MRRTPEDGRSPAERDRDRVLYTTSLRRLAGITQTASAGGPSLLLHNRLTHVLKVAQIGRRLAERLCRVQPQEADEVRVDAEVVEAACLAHDLGHPPFGHLTEQVLDELMVHKAQVPDGFEGNAQSFRIVTHLAERREDEQGLDLTRATLNAILKYPWHRRTQGKGHQKYSAYATEEDDFRFARELDPDTERKSAEAEIMDWADDIAYSVHDMEDFYIAGRIPLDRLILREDERERFLDAAFEHWEDRHIRGSGERPDFKTTLNELFGKTVFAIERPFASDPTQRHRLQQMASWLIDRYISGISLRVPATAHEPFVTIDPEKQREITLLKELTWHYVIRDPSMATQQHGQERVIKGLFDVYHDVVGDARRWHLLPIGYRDMAKASGADGKDNCEIRGRLVCDLISGMTEQQAVELYHRLHGVRLGASLADIVI